MSRRTRSAATSHDAALGGRSPWKFFVLVFALSAPLWLIGAVVDVQWMPGLPLGALGAVCPLIAALILVYKEGKAAGVRALLKRAFDHRRIRAKAWYLPAILLMPGVSVVVYGLARWMDGPLPAPHFPVLATLLLVLIFFAGALAEELGWSGYALDPLQQRWSALQAGLLLGLVAALWHIVPLLQAHRSAAWIAWWSLYAIAGRVLIVWLYNNTGRSVFATVLFHTSLNLSWMLFPVEGSRFDPRLAGPVMLLFAAVVVVFWGPTTLARRRCA